MDSQTILTFALVLAVGAIAFILGERRAVGRRVEPAGGPSPGPSPEAPEPVAKASLPVEEPPPSSRPPDSAGAPKVLTVVPPAAPPVVRLGFEEDDDVDPTRVGPAASAPPAPRVILQPPVKVLVADADAATDEPAHLSPLFLVTATAQTDKGLRRKRNEDCVGVLQDKNLFIVADGMGGYAGGDLASKLAVDTMVRAFETGSFEGPVHKNVPREASDVARAIQMANATIEDEAKAKPDLRGMGTTVCSAAFSPKKRRMYIGHVGDSRCYRLRDGVFKLLTADHTMAEMGVKGPEAQQLSRAVGIWPTVMIDIVMAVPETGDVYLLCSDGLTKMLTDDIIGNVLRNEEDPKVAVDRLIFFANSRGGKDNITVILIRVVPAA
jgi:PPM family protein phosphatase